MGKLYDMSSANMILGYIFNDTSYLSSSKYKLNKEDFYNENTKNGYQFHRILFSTALNLSLNGAKTIDEVAVTEYVEKYRVQYNILCDNDYQDFIENVKSIAKNDDFQIYYERFKKCILLAEYKEKGFDINHFFNLDGDEVEERGKLENYTIEDIVNYYEGLQSDIKTRYLGDDEDTQRKKAGYKGKEILHSFKENPTMGLSFESKYLTTLWGGFEKKQLYIRSGDTSSGKSRSCIGDMACVSVSEIYDSEKGKWIKNLNGANKSLYIGCEMELDREVDPLLWAYIADVPSSKITKGKTTPEEDKRIERAIDILYDSNEVFLTDMPSFNIKKLEEEIGNHKSKHNIDFVIFDYMLLNSALVKEFVQNRSSSIGARGDEILLELSKSLKDLAKKYDVGILTATQVNADIKDYRNRDYQVLRGGKSIADKATGGSISMPIAQQELKLVEGYLPRKGFNKLKPNFVETVYKSRFSEYPKECRIFSYYDLGTMRKKEMFVTDKDFKPINIEKTIVNRIDK